MAAGVAEVSKPSLSQWAARTSTFVAAFLLLVYAAQVIHAIRGQSLTWDEGDHIFAGYEQWKTHDYGLNPEHPPMVKMTATLPLLGLPLNVPKLQGRYFKSEAYLSGREFLFRNGAANGGRYEAADLTFRVRLAAFVFGLFAAVMVFASAREMFSPLAGIAALTLFVFEPTLLAHSAYVTTDMAASGGFLATVYAFWRWSNRPTAARVVVMGLAWGLALAAKHSTVLLLPMLLALAVVVVVERTRGGDASRGAFIKRESLRAAGAVVGPVVGAIVGAGLVACVVLWAWYGFHYQARPGSLVLAPSLAEYVVPLAPREAKGILLLAKFHLLPESYLYGLADVRLMANDMPSYFFGHVYAHGVWFYFPTLLLIKMTLAMLVLLGLCGFLAARGELGSRKTLLFLTAPPAIYLLVAMDSHLNIGARHVMPVFVFSCVLCGAALAVLCERGGGWRVLAGVLVLAHVGTSLAVSPNYMAYANEAWGGPKQTHRFLSDSNVDWAQQLPAVAAYTREHHITQCWIGYFAAPAILPADYGVPCRLLNTADSGFFDTPEEVPPAIDGPVFLSAGAINGFEFGSGALNPFDVFLHTTPAATIRDSVFVFEGHFAVPLDSALGHVVAARQKLAAGDKAAALAEAETAAKTAPGAPAVELAYADALAANGRNSEASAALDRALPVIGTMDADARAKWRERVEAKRKALQ